MARERLGTDLIRYSNYRIHRRCIGLYTTGCESDSGLYKIPELKMSRRKLRRRAMYEVTESENNSREETIVIHISVTMKRDRNLATMMMSHNDSVAGGLGVREQWARV
jgi:hypothetical protein